MLDQQVIIGNGIRATLGCEVIHGTKFWYLERDVREGSPFRHRARSIKALFERPSNYAQGQIMYDGMRDLDPPIDDEARAAYYR